MWKLATFILIFVSGALASRQADTLANCNYIHDADPDDGTFIGWYAINMKSPTDYCNYYQVYSNNSDSATIVDTGAPFHGQVTWFYECDVNNEFVDKYFCLGDITCQSGCQLVTTYNSTDADFNCANVTGECLFKWTTYVNIDPSGCDAGDQSRITRQTYDVNGACQDRAPTYTLQVCSDPEVYSNGISTGYTNEVYTDATCSGGGTNYPNQVNEGVCGMPVNGIEGVLEVNECTGHPGWAWVADGAIDYLGTACDVCADQFDACLQGEGCEVMADFLFFHFPSCSVDFSSLEMDFIDPVWCDANAGLNCTANGFDAMYDCVKSAGCYLQKDAETPLHCTAVPYYFSGIYDVWLFNDEIDGMGTECTPCTAEIETCLADPTKNCEAFGDILFRDVANCSHAGFDGFDGFIDRMWCNATWEYGADCSANGFDAMYQCVQREECLVQMVANSEADSNCSCDISPCIADATCSYVMQSGVLSFDDNPNIFSDIYEVCNNHILPDGNATDCAVFRDFMLCQSGCDEEPSDPDDCFDSNVNATTMFGCIFSSACFEPFNATLASIFNGVCAETLCSPTDLAAAKDNYCVTQGNDCSNSMYNTLYDAMFTCANSECVWLHCTDEIDDCKASEACNEELQFVIHIEDDYDVGGDDDFAGYVKDWYCAGRGGCDAKLDIAYTCATQWNCTDLQADQCWEINCAAEVTACNGNTACIDALITIIGNETQCEAEIASMGGDYMYCPADCDDLDIANYTACGTVMWDGSEMVGDPATTYATYEQCKAACKDCDNFLPIALEKCGDGECGGTFNDLMQCVLRDCPGQNDEEDECFSQTCTASFVDCMFTQECYADWLWVEQYFERFDNLTDYMDVFWYQSTWDIDGCSVANLTSCAEAACAFQCYYYDIREYCEQNGCSIKFWNMLNCFFGCNFEFSLDTIVPTQAPTQMPTASGPTTSEPTTTPIITGVGGGAASYCVGHIGFMVAMLYFILY